MDDNDDFFTGSIKPDGGTPGPLDESGDQDPEEDEVGVVLMDTDDDVGKDDTE